MTKSMFSSALKILGCLALLAFVLVAIIELSPGPAQTSQAAGPNNTSPSPVNTPTLTLTPSSMGYPYPPPQNSQPTQFIPNVSTPTVNPPFSSPAQATAWFKFLSDTPSPSEIASNATMMAFKVHSGTVIAIEKMTGVPDYQPPSYPVKSEADLPNVLYNDASLYTYDANFPCFSNKNPGPAIFVHSLDTTLADYYILPFYKNNKICALAMITVKDGMGTVNGTGEGFGNTYPQVSANEAVNLVEEKTGLKVIGQPILIFRSIFEDYDPFFPYWELQTRDGQTYYVIFFFGRGEGGSIGEKVTVINSKDVTINPH
jgi:hypothetical protein